jgi:spore coat polysaccharide biosynthesis predicted glycosyltransferase SpsG
VADAAPAVGTGHVSRCSAVAAALHARGARVRCLAHGARADFVRDGVGWAAWPEGSALTELLEHVLVLDGARLDAAAAGDRSVALFYDGGALSGDPVLVIAPIAEPLDEPFAQWLHGLRFACLRSVFWGLGARAVRVQAARVLVTTGAGSDGDTLAEALAARLPDALPGVEVAVVRGPFSQLRVPPGVELLDAPDSLHDALLEADLVVCSAGQTSLEAAACGTPAVLVGLDRAQAEQAARVAAAGAGVVASRGDPDAVAAAAAELAGDHVARLEMSLAGQAAVDGYGALRVAYRVAGLSRPPGAGA